MVSKQAIRAEYLFLRKNYDIPTAILENIFINCKKLIDSISINSLGIYYPTKSELNILPLIKEQKASLDILFPKIKPGKQMVFCSNRQGFEKNTEHKFYQPVSNEELIPDFMILPLVTCDQKGNRIGYGKGYYDKYLIQQHIKYKTALIPEKFLYMMDIPSESHDIKLDYVVTERGIISTF